MLNRKQAYVIYQLDLHNVAPDAKVFGYKFVSDSITGRDLIELTKRKIHSKYIVMNSPQVLSSWFGLNSVYNQVHSKKTSEQVARFIRQNIYAIARNRVENIHSTSDRQVDPVIALTVESIFIPSSPGVYPGLYSFVVSDQLKRKSKNALGACYGVKDFEVNVSLYTIETNATSFYYSTTDNKAEVVNQKKDTAQIYINTMHPSITERMITCVPSQGGLSRTDLLIAKLNPDNSLL